jgi:SAM-dependent methyltransferase
MSFEVAAEAYDRFMGRHSRQLAPGMADLAGVRAGMRVLDVGSGPGSLTAELVARLGAGNVVAVDPSESFVAAVAARNPGVEVHRASAEALPFPAATFDAAIAQLVVHFMRDPLAGLLEMRRVTRPGGAVAACVWDHAGNRAPVGPFWAAARTVDPGAHDEGNLPGGRPGHLAGLFEAAGLGDIVETTLAARSEYATFEDWWSPFGGGVGSSGAYVRRLSPELRTAVREACRGRLGDGPIVIESMAWACRGTA